jgi:hypothetical protein
MSESDQLNYLVLPDTHGEYEKVCRIVDLYENSVDKFLFLGDVIDGTNTKPLIGLIRDLGAKAITIAGNHEWVLRNALQEEPEELVGYWRDQLWSRYERDMLVNYQIQPSKVWEHNAEAIRLAMIECGHLEWLNTLPSYYETNSFVAIHAGPVRDIPWELQKKELDSLDGTNGRLQSEPCQLFSHALASVEDMPAEVDGRLFISGHSHLSANLEKRRAVGRVCLGSRTRIGEPMFTWESCTDEIKAHDFS